MSFSDDLYPINLFCWMCVMTGSTLFHDQQVAAGEHVRIWQGEDGNLFEHVFPTGHSITIRCGTLDEARSLMAQSIHEGLDGDLQASVSKKVYQRGGQKHERF